MKIVIDIPEDMYDWFEKGFPDEEDAVLLWQIVKNGIQLETHCSSCVFYSEEGEE